MEIFKAGTDTGGHDGEDDRSLRYLEWTHAPEPNASSYAVDYAILVREAGGETRAVHDRHELGLFPEATWLRLFSEAGLEPLELPVPNPYADEQAAFVARRGAGRRPGGPLLSLTNVCSSSNRETTRC